MLGRLVRDLADPAAVLDELEELVVRLEGIDDRIARVRDGVASDVAAALETVVARTGLERARVLAERAAKLR